jgi:hypothetical protein
MDKYNTTKSKIEDAFYIPRDSNAYGINILLGKIVKGSGIKLMEDSLVYEEKLGIENHKSTVGCVVITEFVEDLFKILQLNCEKFYDGFETQEDMFAFVASTPFFKSSEFTHPKKKYNHPIFEDFTEYLLDNKIVTQGGNITHDYINDFVDFDFLQEIDALKGEEKRKRGAIEKFNGRVIINYHPDFDTNKIGPSMKEFKFSFGNVEKYRDFLLENSIEVVMDKFKEVVKF